MFKKIAAVIVVSFFWIKIDLAVGAKLNRPTRRNPFPIRNGDLELLDQPEKFFSGLFKDIENARESIHMAFFIFHDDEVGREVLSRVKQKAMEGVSVRLLMDYVGSYSFPSEKVASLKRYGIEFEFANKPSLPFFFYTLNRRNHQKIVIIDGEIGYTGGFNVGNMYYNKDPELGFWKDYQLRVTGHGVQDLQCQFIKDWKKAGQTLDRSEGLFPPLHQGKNRFRLISSDGAHLNELIKDYIQSAEELVEIFTPYFIPTEGLKEALIHASKRGVKVNIMIPHRQDHPLVKEGAFSYFEALLENGCNVLAYKGGFFHGKVFMADRKMCYVGTANFDQRSFKTNEEIVCVSEDKDFLSTLIDSLSEVLESTEKVTMEKVKRGPVSLVKQQFSRLVAPFL
ncbi:cardiolipin synthase [Pseudalkalibacillus caeni]|uniref:Cardiolipin synthase n=1 Tax=Exobacillus caeni TaxID=2574798 RepID=A0A5R9F3Q0_9BACL|nr:cardiolipin synthase [Pseudalkalibacillus caeni]TLS37020.1 cardiolipin synthase [Pseudalkalibacillus caeni]